MVLAPNSQDNVVGESGFETFVSTEGVHLRRALVARFGTQVGVEVHADVLARAWQDWERIGAMQNPAGFLWSMARGDSRRYRRWSNVIPFQERELLDHAGPEDRELFLSLGALSDAERVAVVMVHAHGASYREVADLLGVPVSTITNHVHRGLRRLRHALKEQYQ